VAITIAYYGRKKFPVSTYRLFGVALITLVVNLSLSILFCVLLDNSNVVPIAWVEAVAELYFFMQLVESYLLFAYVFYSIGKSLRYSPIYLLTILPSALGAIFMFTNCLHHLNFTFVLNSETGVYDFLPGPGLFILLYVINWGFNTVATLTYTIVFRKILPKQLLFTLLCVMGIVATAAILQTLYPQVILSGASFTLSVMLAIVSVCDPDVKVDRFSKAFNNEAFIEYINVQRFEKQRKHYIIFDIESFGMFSEKFGVVASNELVSIVRKFIEGVNKKSFIFRTTSSRFVVLLRNEKEQLEMVNAIKERFDKPVRVKGNEVVLTINLFYFVNNMAFYNSDLYNNFVARTLSAINFKDSNCIELGQEFMDRVNRDRKIRDILENCLKTKTGLYMVYQPIFDMKKKCFNHCEALIRLDNNELGYVGPGEFIPIAESFGLANQIDFFVLNETCAFLQRHPEIESLEVNISCAEFFNNPSERFLKTINQYGVDPNRLCLEITETIAVKYPTKTREFMNDLGQHGIKFAMDDFGSGYSNMARFITLPFSVAKLDKSLLGEAVNVKVFFDAAVNLFRSLEIPIVIEGVENEEQLAMSKNKKIDFVQGYYFTKPLREKELLEFLNSNKK
jgi:EAL domain-containing protein (putative c-di-GMP-specific phosphodiesterase class I)/GGDEF domain-containing protein